MKITIKECDSLKNFIDVLRQTGVIIVKIKTQFRFVEHSCFTLTAFDDKLKTLFEWKSVVSEPKYENGKLDKILQLKGFVVSDGIWKKEEIEELLSGGIKT